MNFFSALTILFIALKLTDYIDWSWWLVLLPSYGGIALLVTVTVIEHFIPKSARKRK
jgi:hypothetical protein